MMPEARGRLVLDEEGYSRVVGDDRVVPIWPADFDVECEGGEVLVLDRWGWIVARVGERVHMGGGGIGRESPVEGNVIDEEQKQKLLERRPGSYFLVGAPPRWMWVPCVRLVRKVSELAASL